MWTVISILQKQFIDKNTGNVSSEIIDVVQKALYGMHKDTNLESMLTNKFQSECITVGSQLEDLLATLDKYVIKKNVAFVPNYTMQFNFRM